MTRKKKTDSASGQVFLTGINRSMVIKKGGGGVSFAQRTVKVNCKLFSVSMPPALGFRNNFNVSGQISVYPILLDLITRTILGEEYRSLSSSKCRVLHSYVTSSILGTNILLSTLFSNILSLRSSLNVRDQVSRPYSIRQNYSSVYINP